MTPLLEQTLGFQNSPRVPFAAKVIERTDKGDYCREKIIIRTAPHVVMPFYLLTPKAPHKMPVPVVLAFHGHGDGARDVVGIRPDGTERDKPEGYHADFAIALCRRGFVVAAPELADFGERQTDFSYLNRSIGKKIPTSCNHTAFMALHAGGSVLGMRVRDVRRLIDWLATRPGLDAQRIGAMGISGGGMLTFFSTAVEPRIKASVVSGYFCEWAQSILYMRHCVCNIVPGLQRFGEIADVAGLIAPRPMLIEAASHDPIFPIAGVRRAFARGRLVYRVYGAERELAADYFKGGHAISGRLAYDFLLVSF